MKTGGVYHMRLYCDCSSSDFKYVTHLHLHVNNMQDLAHKSKSLKGQTVR